MAFCGFLSAWIIDTAYHRRITIPRPMAMTFRAYRQIISHTATDIRYLLRECVSRWWYISASWIAGDGGNFMTSWLMRLLRDSKGYTPQTQCLSDDLPVIIFTLTPTSGSFAQKLIGQSLALMGLLYSLFYFTSPLWEAEYFSSDFGLSSAMKICFSYSTSPRHARFLIDGDENAASRLHSEALGSSDITRSWRPSSDSGRIPPRLSPLSGLLYSSASH